MPQLDRRLRLLFEHHCVSQRILIRFSAHWEAQPFPGTRNAAGRRNQSRAAAATADAACARVQAMADDPAALTPPSGLGAPQRVKVLRRPFQILANCTIAAILRVGAGPSPRS
eukprot:3331705-Pyramimonas_sp.AAC.1